MTSKTTQKAKDSRDARVKKKPGRPAGISSAGMKERRMIFAETYIANGNNATAAAIEAGYSDGYARVAGYQMLKHPDVVARLTERTNELAKQYSLETNDMIRSISQELHFDPAKLFNKDGSLKKIHEIDEDTRMALTSIETEQIGSQDAPVFVRKYKWAAKHQARDQAMRHLGMFAADNAQKNSPLADLPREMVRQIVERLRQLNGRGGR